jgi:protein-tyrosine phosphatase
LSTIVKSGQQDSVPAPYVPLPGCNLNLMILPRNAQPFDAYINRCFDCHMELDISRITDTLYVAAEPKPNHIAQLQTLPVRLLLTLRLWPPRASVRHSVEQWIHLPCLDSPLTPMPMLLLWNGVQSALPVMERGEIVMVHCHYGIHRSVALATCILIAQGQSALDAMTLVKQKRPVADPYAGHIRSRIEKFEREWS